MNTELQFLIYNAPQENIKVDVVVKDETIWLTQKAMAAFQKLKTLIPQNIIYKMCNNFVIFAN